MPGARVTVRHLAVSNKGRELRELTAHELSSSETPEVLRLRGYKVETVEQHRIIFDTPGDFEVNETVTGAW